MRTAKSDLTGMYAQSIGIEAARELIAKKIDAAALEDKDSYIEEEIIRICNELLKEGGLTGIVAQTFLIQLEYRKSEEQRLLLDNIDTQIWYLADIETYGAVNKAHAEFFGMEKEDLEGGNLADVLSREESEICIDGNRGVFEKKRQIRIEEWIKNGRGEPRLLSVTKTPKLNDDGDVEYVICAAEDITKRNLAEEQITRLNSVLRAIRNVNELLVTEKDRGQLLRKSCDALIDARGYDAVWLSLFEDGKRFVEVVGSGFPEDVSRFSRRMVSGDNPPCIRDALASKETVLILDKSRDCEDCFFKDACRGREVTILHVEHAGRFFGLLAVLLAPDVAVDDEEKSLLAEVASDIAIGLHDIEIMGILREREQIVRKQNEMLMELAKCKELYSGDLADSLQVITEATAHAVEVERVSLWLYEAGHSTIRCVDLYTMNTDSHSEGMVLAAVDYPSYFKALEEGAFIAAHDAHRDPRTKEFSDSYLSPLGITSLLDVPIRLKGEVVGVVCYEHVGPARKWTMEEENFARSPADYVSLAMEADERRRAEEALRHATLSLQEHVWLLEESNKRAEEASRLREYFLKETSHRIITPVTIVGGYSKWLLRSNNLNKDQKEKIRTICERNEEVQTLVRDALEEKYLADIK
ncbi:MAG: GAF domain-containing protein [ANME-2 cluster archaeon]|jgi:PAS domain S-box-containing protein|nr:MAG: GAF domain-containing protein [ANME-2 cluster archaeon]